LININQGSQKMWDPIQNRHCRKVMSPSVRPSVRLLPSVTLTFACRSIDPKPQCNVLRCWIRGESREHAAQEEEEEEEEEEESYINYERSDHNDQHLISCTWWSISAGTEFCPSFFVSQLPPSIAVASILASLMARFF